MILLEIAENAAAHAGSEVGFWVHVQKYAWGVEMAVADAGRGISESLKENPAFAHLSPEERFRKAFELGVSREAGKKRGEGLAWLKKWVEENRLDGAVLSGKQYAVFRRGSPSFGTVEEGKTWPGTLVWVKAEKTRPLSLLDIWERMGLTEDVDF